MLFIIYISLTSKPPTIPQFRFADKLGHLLGYATLTGWFVQLYAEKTSQIFIVIAFCLLGIGIEFAQGYGGVRMFEYADMAANALGALIGWWLSRTLFAGTLLNVDQFLASKIKS